MKKMLFTLLIMPGFLFAQWDEYEVNIFKKHQPDNIGISILLPDPKEYYFYRSFKILPGEKQFFIISEDSLYRKIFTGIVEAEIPIIDFCEFNLHPFIAFSRCLVDDDEGIKKKWVRHHGNCKFQKAWYLMPKKISLVNKSLL